MIEEPSAWTRRNGKWCPTITAPDGSILIIGEYETREQAADAYRKKAAELYPVSVPQAIDPAKHQTLDAAPLEVKKPSF